MLTYQSTTNNSLALNAQAQLWEIIEGFLASLDVSASSLATYKRQLTQFVVWLADSGKIAQLNTLSKADILEYKSSLLEAGKSARTVSGYLTPVRKLFSFLESEGAYKDIAKDVKGVKRSSTHAKDTLSKAQLRQVLGSIDTSTLSGARDYALFNLMARTGLRTIEVSRALVGDMRQELGTDERAYQVLYIQGKGRADKDEYVILTPDALKPIKAYLAMRGKLTDNSPLFVSDSIRSKGEALSTRSVSWIIKELLKSVGLESKRLTAHSLRHTAITLSILGGASIYSAQAMARHKSITTTEQYFHNLNRLKEGAELAIDF